MSFTAAPTESFDVIVVGGGHAGCEAAITTARLGLNTALFSLNLDRIAWQPCNPAVGGPAKSQLVHEVDALGELEPISPQAAFKGVIAGSSVKSVVTSAGGL